MATLEVLLERELLDDNYALGRLFVAGIFYCYTCEDTDRELETFPGAKIHGSSAIPRGRYRVTKSLSARFGRVMPILVDVPGFSGVRFHGGNTAADTEGCPLLGSIRTRHGVANCKDVNAAFLKLIADTEDKGDEVWVTVK